MNSSTADRNASTVPGPEVQPQDALVGGLLGLLACGTVLGNCLVMLAVLSEPYLRTVTNYLIVSLATADLLMGAVVMPFAAIAQATRKRWLFGPTWCDLWHAFDVLSSTASILNLCMIALERYWAVRNPMRYPSRVTKRRCVAMIAAVWLCSSLISFPAIAWWRVTSPTSRFPSVCSFTSDPVYLICSSFVSFYVPLFVMVFVYCKIYRTAARLVRSWRDGAKVLRGHGEQATVVLRIHRGGGGGGGGTGGGGGGGGTGGPADEPNAIAEDAGETERNRFIDGRVGGVGGGGGGGTGSANRCKQFARFSRERRAAKTLGVVMGVFIACWLPFFVCSSLSALSGPGGLGRYEKSLLAVVTWLGYCNSAVNPVIYAHSMRDFRRAFLRLLSCQRRQRRAAPVTQQQQLRHRQLLQHRREEEIQSGELRQLHTCPIQVVEGSNSVTAVGVADEISVSV